MEIKCRTNIPTGMPWGHAQSMPATPPSISAIYSVAVALGGLALCRLLSLSVCSTTLPESPPTCLRACLPSADKSWTLPPSGSGVRPLSPTSEWTPLVPLKTMGMECCRWVWHGVEHAAGGCAMGGVCCRWVWHGVEHAAGGGVCCRWVWHGVEHGWSMLQVGVAWGGACRCGTGMSGTQHQTCRVSLYLFVG